MAFERHIHRGEKPEDHQRIAGEVDTPTHFIRRWWKNDLIQRPLGIALGVEKALVHFLVLILDLGVMMIDGGAVCLDMFVPEQLPDG